MQHDARFMEGAFESVVIDDVIQDVEDVDDVVAGADVLERRVGHVCDLEPRVGEAPAEAFDADLGDVHAGDPGTACVVPLGEEAGAAADVQDAPVAHRNAAERTPEALLLAAIQPLVVLERERPMADGTDRVVEAQPTFPVLTRVKGDVHRRAERVHAAGRHRTTSSRLSA
jgi:hypothetical protein